MTYYSVYKPSKQRYEIYADFSGLKIPDKRRAYQESIISIDDVLPSAPATAGLCGSSDVPIGIVAQGQHRDDSDMCWLLIIGGLLWLLR